MHAINSNKAIGLYIRDHVTDVGRPVLNETLHQGRLSVLGHVLKIVNTADVCAT